MQLDWITTVAQIVNFLVLVYLLKRFLYKPLVVAMERREEGIAARLAEAEDRSAIAEAQMSEYREKISEFEQQRAGLIEEAKRDGEAQRNKFMDELRQEIAEIRTRWREEAQREQQAYLAQARHAVGSQVCLIARRALDDLADAQLEEQMLRVFLAKLGGLPNEDKSRLAAHGAVSVRTSYQLSPAAREQIRSAIQAEIAPGLEIEFEHAADLLCGIRLGGPGFKTEWNLESYLDGLGEQLARSLAFNNPDGQSGGPREQSC